MKTIKMLFLGAIAGCLFSACSGTGTEGDDLSRQLITQSPLTVSQNSVKDAVEGCGAGSASGDDTSSSTPANTDSTSTNAGSVSALVPYTGTGSSDDIQVTFTASDFSVTVDGHKIQISVTVDGDNLSIEAPESNADCGVPVSSSSETSSPSEEGELPNRGEVPTEAGDGSVSGSGLDEALEAVIITQKP